MQLNTLRPRPNGSQYHRRHFKCIVFNKTDVETPSLNGWWVIVRTSKWLPHTRTDGRTDTQTDRHRQQQCPKAKTGNNKANLRDLIAATGLVILLKLDLNCRFFSPCDLVIWWMTPKNNRAPLLCYFKLFASFRSHWWIQTGWPPKIIGHLFYATLSFLHHFVAIGEYKLELQSGNA